jgi:hypothetical protein
MFNINVIPNKTAAETIVWRDRVIAAGGGFENNSLAIANNLVRVLHGKSYYSKIKYLLPMLGQGIGAARVPLIDSLNVGAATNTSFLDADFNQSTGLQGNGTTKRLDSLIKPSQLGTSNNGGLGWWENNISLGGNVQPIGCYNTASTNRYVIDLRANVRNFRWGVPGNGAGDTTTATNGHYYGQRSSSTNRSLYFNASLLNSNATNDATSGASDRSILIVGCDEGGSTITPWPGRGAMAYLTDGSLTTIEISDFDAVLRSYLFAPTGRPTS